MASYSQNYAGISGSALQPSLLCLTWSPKKNMLFQQVNQCMMIMIPVKPSGNQLGIHCLTLKSTDQQCSYACW